MAMKVVGCTLKHGGYTSLSVGVDEYESKRFLVSSYGNFSLRSGGNISLEGITSLYEREGEKVVRYLSGAYIILFYDKRDSTLDIVQDPLGSPLNVYFTYKPGELSVCSSLQRLLQQEKGYRAIDDSVVMHFLLNGYVVGHRTLVDSINKIPPGYFLRYRDGKTYLLPNNYDLVEISSDESIQEWDTTLSSAVLNHSKENAATIALSSGYDSNYILNVLSRSGKESIKAYSIGGCFKENELPAVEAIVSKYQNVDLYKAETDSSTFERFPDLVFRLDGQIYERGILLQYELAKMLANNNETDIICGECANEIMHFLFNSESKTDVCPSDSTIFGCDPYICASYLIIKKSGIMMNSFGVNSHYPFVEAPVLVCCTPLRYLNQDSKLLHIENCKKITKPEVFALLVNRGGATKVSSVLDVANNERLDALMASNKYFKYFGGKAFAIKNGHCKDVVQRAVNYNLKIKNPFKLVRSETLLRKREYQEKMDSERNLLQNLKLACLSIDITEKCILEERSAAEQLLTIDSVYGL